MNTLKDDVPAFPKHQDLIKPLEWSEAVCRCYCRQCGILREINNTQAIKLQNIAGQKIMGDIKDFYFIVSYCDYCPENELTIEIKKIPSF